MTSRASAASCSRFCRIALEAAPQQAAQLVRRLGRQAIQSISPRSTAAIVSEAVSPSNGRRPVSIS